MTNHFNIRYFELRKTIMSYFRGKNPVLHVPKPADLCVQKPHNRKTTNHRNEIDSGNDVIAEFEWMLQEGRGND